MSYHLSQRGREHVLIERDRLGGRWHSERWDLLHYQFPNWSLRLPGHSYSGDDPEGFCHYSKVIEFLDDYARKIDPPARVGVEVESVRLRAEQLILETSGGQIAADNVVVASGAFPHPRIPDFAAKLSPSIVQMHSAAYRSPAQLPDGAVLVVGSGSSGGQIAEELHRSGRPVFLSVSRHRRIPRRFSGKDMLWWLLELGWMDRPIDTLPDRRPAPALLVTGIDGGHDLDVRQFGADGMALLGSAVDGDGTNLTLADNLAELLDDADDVCAEFLSAAGELARERGMDVEETWSARAPSTSFSGYSHRPRRGRDHVDRLVHGLPPRLRLDRDPGVRCRGSADPETRPHGVPGSLFSRIALDAHVEVGRPVRRWRGCGTHRRADRLLANGRKPPYVGTRTNGGNRMIGWIVLGVVVLVLLYFVAIYNRLVRLRALVKEGFSGITVQLRRRADLIPNLVESVQGYATHEREVFEEVSKRPRGDGQRRQRRRRPRRRTRR